MTVVVVGGGIVGLASAYELARQGRDVVVCERGSIGAGNTERSAGGIRTQFSTAENVALSVASLQIWESFAERFGVDPSLRQPGYLFLARTEATADALEAAVATQNEQGVPSQLLSAADAAERCPAIDPDPFVAGSYAPTDGFLDPHLALQGYARAAREEGVDIRTETEVRDVLCEDGASGGGPRVTGVETPAERISADYVVNAAGAWAGEIAAMADVSLPVEAVRRQIAVVEPDTSIDEGTPLTVDLGSGAYFRPERDGAALVGGHFADDAHVADPDGYDRSMDFAWAVEALETVADWTTAFGPESAIVRGWAGLYAKTPDDNAIVEETIPGFVTATGFSGHGFQHAPATGQIVADLIADGETSLVGIEAFSSDRFETGDDSAERHVV